MAIDTTFLDSDSDQVKPARPAIKAMADEINLINGSGGAARVGFTSNVSSPPTREIQSVLRERALTPQDCGLVDTAANTLATFQKFAAASARRKHIPAGTYNLSSLTATLAFRPDDFVTGDGDATVLDASGAASLAAGNAVVGIAGTLTNLGAILSATASAGAVTFTVTSAAGLAVGDVLCFYNTTNSSWAGWRTEYRAGEFVQIGRISGTTIYVTQPLYDTYATTVQVYKMGGTGGSLSNMKIKTPASQVIGWQIDASVGVSVSNVHTAGTTTYAGGEFKRCFGITYLGDAFQCSPSVDDEYGVTISNSQCGNFVVHATGGRHPLSFGGGDYACCVPTRNHTVIGNSYNNLGPTGSGDLHGNTEDIKFFGLTFANGSDVGGANHKFVACWFRGNTNSGNCLYSGEPVKGTFTFTDCLFDTYVDPTASAFGVVHIGNITTNVKGALRYVFTNPVFSAPAATVYLICVDIVSGSYAPDLIITNPVISSAPGCTQFLRLQRSGGPTTLSNITIGPDVTNLNSGAQFVFNAGTGLTVTNYRLPSQAGSVSVPIGTAASTYSSAGTFRNPYPVTPIIVTGSTASIIGGKRAKVSAVSSSETGFNAEVATPDAANFASSDTAVVRFIAHVNT